MMSSTLLAVVLGIAVLISAALILLSARRHAFRPWRTGALLLLSVISALMLYYALIPPTRQVPVGQRMVMTAGSDTVGNLPVGQRVALPEAPAGLAVPRVPDLASLLRRSPDIGQLLIVGDGLPARDREAVAGRGVRFLPSAPPIGLTDFWMPESISTGHRWLLRIRVSGMADARVELRDPSGALVDAKAVDASGQAALSDIARAAGRVNYQLRVLDSAGKIRENFTVPVAVSQPTAMKLLSHAGGPGPDLKSLRRWALDAGLQLQSHIALGPGMAVRTEDSAIRAETLAEQDMLIVDERAWQNFDAGQRRNIREAVANGLGLLLRVTGPMSAQTAADFRQMGLRIDAATLTQSVQLTPDAGSADWPTLTRQPVRVSAADARIVLTGTQGEPLALWRAQGNGRVGVLLLSDSFRLALAGYGDAHSRIWSDLVSMLARPQTEMPPVRRGDLAWPQERMVFCQLQPGATVQTDSERQALSVETTGSNRGCAGFWPQAAGWYTLYSDENQLPFYVHSPKEGEALRRSLSRAATLKLVTPAPDAAMASRVPVPGSPWPWFLGWVLASSLLWWMERSRLGRGM
ncbi:hypothetical protein [Arenimonas sp. GDDSR-1]|uniref:hypothetical protein n=1 Tax=Arenimonas sp. GDDSR-1 TaxID=2950125 RepID=UPI00260386DB|nr:hypothetical protein [Arenimonas sp. GDDSR-1]